MGTPFKVAGEVKLMTVSQRQMSAALELSTTRTNELINEGVLIRDASTEQGRLMLFESLQNYFLSKKTTTEGANFWKERSLHERAKRQMAELNLRIKEGELYESAVVHAELAEWLIMFRTKLMGVGHKLAPRLEGMSSAQMCELIDAEIYSILKELAENVRDGRFTEDELDATESAAAPDG